MSSQDLVQTAIGLTRPIGLVTCISRFGATSDDYRVQGHSSPLFLGVPTTQGNMTLQKYFCK